MYICSIWQWRKRPWILKKARRGTATNHFMFWILGSRVKGVPLVKIMQIFQKFEELQHMKQFSRAFLDKGYSSSVGLLCVPLLIRRYDCIWCGMESRGDYALSQYTHPRMAHVPLCSFSVDIHLFQGRETSVSVPYWLLPPSVPLYEPVCPATESVYVFSPLTPSKSHSLSGDVSSLQGVWET